MINSKVEQSQINNAAWSACDTFRGTIDAASYKDYILVMLFLKYISDVYSDHLKQYKAEFGDNAVRIQRRLARERFILPEVEIIDPDTKKVLDRFAAHFDRDRKSVV